MRHQTRSKAGKGFAVATVLLDAIGIAMIFPILPALLAELGIHKVADAALYGGALATVYAAMQFVFMPIFGNLSDRFGRRPVLLVAILALFVDYLVMGFASSYAVLFIGRIVAGIAGATVSTASAYMADVSAPGDRAKNFGLIGAAFGIGFILGPALGGAIGAYGTRWPFFLAAAFSLLNFSFGLFFLPESLPPEKRRPFRWRRANPFGALKTAFALHALRPLLLVTFCLMLSGAVYTSVWAFYGVEKFGWGELMIGLTLTTYGVGLAVVQGGLIRLIHPKLGDRKTILLGMGIILVGMVAIAFATQTWVIFSLLPLVVLGEIAGPTLNGMMSKLKGDDEQGELQGVMSSLQSLSAIMAPPLYAGLFKMYSDSAGVYFPGAPFLASVAVLAVGLLVFIRIPRGVP